MKKQSPSSFLPKGKNETTHTILIAAICLSLFPPQWGGSGWGFSQNIAINTTGNPANASAILDVNATNLGLLMPRMTFCQRTTPSCAGGLLDASGNLPAAAQGLLVYQTDAGVYGEGFYYNTSITTTPIWLKICGNAVVVLHNDPADCAVSNTTIETDLCSFTLPANTLATPHATLKVQFQGGTDASTGTRIRFYLGTVELSVNGTFTVGANAFFGMDILFSRETATSASGPLRMFINGNPATVIQTGVNATSGVDWTVNNVLKFTATNTVGTGTTTQGHYLIEYLPGF